MKQGIAWLSVGVTRRCRRQAFDGRSGGGKSGGSGFTEVAMKMVAFSRFSILKFNMLAVMSMMCC